MTKTKLTGCLAIIAIVVSMAININLNTQSNNDLSLLSLANIEALAEYELPEVVITCSTGGEGQCWVDNGDYETVSFFPVPYYVTVCDFSGKTNDFCFRLPVHM